MPGNIMRYLWTTIHLSIKKNDGMIDTSRPNLSEVYEYALNGLYFSRSHLIHLIILIAQFSLYVHEKTHSFHFIPLHFSRK